MKVGDLVRLWRAYGDRRTYGDSTGATVEETLREIEDAVRFHVEGIRKMDSRSRPR